MFRNLKYLKKHLSESYIAQHRFCSMEAKRFSMLVVTFCAGCAADFWDMVSWGFLKEETLNWETEPPAPLLGVDMPNISG